LIGGKRLINFGTKVNYDIEPTQGQHYANIATPTHSHIERYYRQGTYREENKIYPATVQPSMQPRQLLIVSPINKYIQKCKIELVEQG